MTLFFPRKDTVKIQYLFPPQYYKLSYHKQIAYIMLDNISLTTGTLMPDLCLETLLTVLKIIK